MGVSTNPSAEGLLYNTMEDFGRNLSRRCDVSQPGLVNGQKAISL